MEFETTGNHEIVVRISHDTINRIPENIEIASIPLANYLYTQLVIYCSQESQDPSFTDYRAKITMHDPQYIEIRKDLIVGKEFHGSIAKS